MPRRKGSTTRPAPRATPARRASRTPRLAWALLALAAAAGATAFWPRSHAWQSLGKGLGRIRWVDTRSGFPIEPPLAPHWVRDLHRRGIPWPTDLPLTPPGATFGAASGGVEQTAAWYLIQSGSASNELWHLDKQSVTLVDSMSRPVPWPGGSGAVLLDSERRLQYLYLGVPRQLSRSGARVRFRLARFRGSSRDGLSTRELTLQF